MLKKIWKIVLIIFLTIVTLFILLFILINYFAWLNWKVRSGENFCKDKKFSIWKAFVADDRTYFCDNNTQGKCLDWKINWKLLNKENSLYMFFELSDFIWKTEEEINEKISKLDESKWRTYRLFQNDSYENRHYAKTYDEIIRFLKVSYDTCELKFYNNIDIESLTDNEKNIFKNLENSN
jgi:hypothetical protein